MIAKKIKSHFIIPANLSFVNLSQGRLTQPRLLINDRKLIAENIELILSPAKSIKPDWLKTYPNYPINFSRVYSSNFEGEILAYFQDPQDGSNKYPAIVLNNKTVIFNFNPLETMLDLLSKNIFTNKRPIYTHLPFHYHRVPGQIRYYINRIITTNNVRKFRKHIYPHWPIESSIELLRYICLNCSKLISNSLTKFPYWPDNKRYAIVLTHDIDTKCGLKKSKEVSELEKDYELRSCLYVVGTLCKSEFNALSSLIDDGFEVGIHGYNHDNKISFLNKRDIKKRLDMLIWLIERLHVKGFRSPSLLRTENLFDEVEEIFEYDSSIPDTEIAQPSPGNGCGTVFPFYYEKLLILPVTIPMDSTLLALGYDPKSILRIWLQKLAFIKRIGGLAVFVTHPEPHFSGNKKMFDIYKRLLDEIVKDSEAWITLPKDVCSWWRGFTKDSCNDNKTSSLVRL